MPDLKVFQIVKIGSLFVIFDASDGRADGADCKAIVVNESVTIVDWSWRDIADLVQVVARDCVGGGAQCGAATTASLVCLVRDKDDEAAADDSRGDAYDDQLVAFHDYLHVSPCLLHRSAPSLPPR